MKNLVILLLSCLLFFSLQAQNLGVDQPNPASKVDVNGNLTVGKTFSGSPAPESGAIIEGRVGLSVDSARMDSITRLQVKYQMTQPAPMVLFSNTGLVGVALTAINNDSISPFNGLEGVTSSISGSNAPAGVMGIALAIRDSSIAIGVRGATNNDHGIGVLGTRRAVTAASAGGGFGGLFLNDIGFSGGFYNVSDGRFKKDIQPLTGALSQLMQIQAVSYQFDLKQFPHLGLRQGTEYGIIAQQVETVFPDMVVTKTLDLNACKPLTAGHANPTDLKEVKMVDYVRMIPVLIKAVQEQQDKIESLEKEIETLKKQK